jgi:ferredoxin-NADP reductase
MVVRSMTVEADGIIGIELVGPGPRRAGYLAPGARVALVLGGGLTRQYSRCGDPADRRRYLLGVLRDPNAASESWHGTSRTDT